MERIKNSNYNRDYSELVEENLPEYLRGMRKKKERRMIARMSGQGEDSIGRRRRKGCASCVQRWRKT